MSAFTISKFLSHYRLSWSLLSATSEATWFKALSLSRSVGWLKFSVAYIESGFRFEAFLSYTILLAIMTVAVLVLEKVQNVFVEDVKDLQKDLIKEAKEREKDVLELKKFEETCKLRGISFKANGPSALKVNEVYEDPIIAQERRAKSKQLESSSQIID